MTRILVVEDESAIARGLKFNFEQEGYQVDIAEDGPAALDIIRSADPEVDLVVLDLMLPQMSGYETCRELRRLDQDVPVLALTVADSGGRQDSGLRLRRRSVHDQTVRAAGTAQSSPQSAGTASPQRQRSTGEPVNAGRRGMLWRRHGEFFPF